MDRGQRIEILRAIVDQMPGETVSMEEVIEACLPRGLWANGGELFNDILRLKIEDRIRAYEAIGLISSNGTTYCFTPRWETAKPLIDAGLSPDEIGRIMRYKSESEEE